MRRLRLIPAMLIPASVLAFDVILRHSDVSSFNWESGSVYALSFVFSLCLWNFIAAVAGLLRRSAPVLFAVLLFPVVGYLVFAYISHYAFYSYFKHLPNSFTFEYMGMEHSHFFTVARDYLGIPGALAIGGIAALILAVLWFGSAPGQSGTLFKRSWSYSLWFIAFIGSSAVYNNNIQFFGQASLPEASSTIIPAQVILNRLAGVQVGTRTLGTRLNVKLPPAGKVAGLNVLLVLNESLTWQRMSLYGYERKTTPELDAFLARHPDRAFIFRRAVTNSTSTDVSLASLFTGLSPVLPGPLWHSVPIIFEYGKMAGSTTLFYSSHWFHWENIGEFFKNSSIDSLWNREISGLPTYNDIGIDDRATISALISRADKLKSGQERFLAVLHVNGTHYPYKSPDEFRKWKGGLGEDYDSATFFLDANLSRVWTWLEGSGLLDDTAIIFTSDHGESLAAKGQKGHMVGFLEPQTHVPFWVLLPKRMENAAPSIKANGDLLVSNQDIVPTLLELLGVESEPAIAQYTKNFQGSSLLKPLPATRDIFLITYTAGNNVVGEPAFALISGTCKYIVDSRNGRAREFYYDLKADPGEARDLWTELPDGEKDRLRRSAYRFDNSREIMKKLKIPEPAL